MIVPTTHYLTTLVLNGGYITGILTVFMVQGPNKIVLATKLYPMHFLVAAHATIVMISGPSTFTMKPESILNIAKCTVNYAPTHASSVGHGCVPCRLTRSTADYSVKHRCASTIALSPCACRRP